MEKENLPFGEALQVLAKHTGVTLTGRQDAQVAQKKSGYSKSFHKFLNSIKNSSPRNLVQKRKSILPDGESLKI